MMQMRAFLLLLLLASGAGAGAVTNRVHDCHPGDKAALLAVKAALGSPYHFASWTPDTPCCAWYDVGCDPSTARVVELSVFQDANLTGAIPDAVAGLTHLQNLMLHHLPALSGPIPRSLARLSNLSQLTISYTAVSGPVPAFLAQLTKLTLLDLSFNSLSGAVPPSLADLPNLSGINLSRNRLAGTLPPLLLSKTSGQVYLWLSHNTLTGTIPPAFAAVSFAHVDLSRNNLTGDASMLFGKGKAVQSMDLSRNALSFDMSAVELPEGLRSLDVSHNAIYGGVPAQVANLTDLQLFNVSYNRMCGELPGGGTGIMARFDAYSFQHNSCLCGAPLAPCK